MPRYAKGEKEEEEVPAPPVKTAADYKAEGAEFLAAKKATPGYHLLPSGMLIKSLKKGGGVVSPGANTQCEVHYSGTLIDGTKFDSSRDRGRPSKFAPNEVIAGWTEALQLMREGDMVELVIPSNLAYGDRGAYPKIPGGSTLVFEVELVKCLGTTKAPARSSEDADKKLMAALGKTGAQL